MKNLAIIGASYLQLPLILKAKELGYVTHVFAWKSDDVGEKAADYFYPISIVEKDLIADKCKEIGIDGIVSIATDLGAITVNYVANKLGLIGNSLHATEISTNKHLMRLAFEKGGDPSPKSRLVSSYEQAKELALEYPVIVKPTDRSGSRAITKLEDNNGLKGAVERAIEQSFEKKALIEEYACGQEYSVECITYHGEHNFLAVTKKFTTGSPKFIETGHLEPAPISDTLTEKIKKTVFHALDTLNITEGASHTEIKIDEDENIRLIEIGGRMGGDCIGSDLVYLSTGVDFVKAVIDVALGNKPDLTKKADGRYSLIRFVFDKNDLGVIERIKKEHPEIIVREDNMKEITGEVTDSSTRFGAIILKSDSMEVLKKYLPRDE